MMAKRNQNRTEEEIPSGVYLADGTFLNADAGQADGFLWVWMRDDSVDILTAAQLFSDRSRTEHISYTITESQKQEWDYFTKINLIRLEEENKVSIRMVRG